MVRWLWAPALALVAAPAVAQTMTVEAFLVKAHALKSKGVFAIFSSDLAPVRAEVKAVATDYRRTLSADKAAGRPPHSCPPPEGSDAAKIKPEAFLADLERTVPPGQRQISMKTAFYQIMKRRWPCAA